MSPHTLRLRRPWIRSSLCQHRPFQLTRKRARPRKIEKKFETFAVLSLN